jgi:membrane protease YdiL (CAAX protease family)
MQGKIDQKIKQRRGTLFVFLFSIFLYYSLILFPVLFLYPQDNPETVPRVLLFFYELMQEKHESNKLFIERNAVLSLFARSELIKSVLFIFMQAFFLVIPLFFYRKTIIKTYMSRIKTVGSIDKQAVILFLATLFSMIIYVIICSAYSKPQNLPSFDLKYIIFWTRYIFILCFLAPFCEEFLFRGIVLSEIKHCYNFTPRLIIFSQACIFFVFHFLFANNFPAVTLLLGIVTGIFAFYTNSLLYSLLYHICYNLFIFLMQTGIVNLSEVKISYFIIIPLTFLFFFLNILSVILFIRCIKRKPAFVENSMVS